MAEGTAPAPRLRVFRELDVSKLTKEFKEAIAAHEGADILPYVDANRPRDIGLTEEIMEHTIGAILVNPEGETLARFEGRDGWLKAEKARASARVTFNLDFDEEPSPVQRKGRGRTAELGITPDED